MSMFPPFTTAEYLETIPERYGDVKSAVALSPDRRYTKGSHWSFWMEDDPRVKGGIMPLAKYKCYESGNGDSKWELIE